MVALLTTLALALQALAGTTTASSARHASHRRQTATAAATAPGPVMPQVLSGALIANLTDPTLSRDSCVATRIKSRTLWTCRDTMYYDAKTQKTRLPQLTNTAGWTDFNNDGTPKITSKNNLVGSGSNGSNPILQMYGDTGMAEKQPFYPLSQTDACTTTPGGRCDDGSRTVLWQDSAPMVTSSNIKGDTIAYTWISNLHIDGLKARVLEPSYSLYEMTYDNTTPDKYQLPTNKLLDQSFWDAGEIGYGAYGRVVRKGWCYLYGVTLYRNIALAKVPVKDVEDKSKYQYYVSGKWVNKAPKRTDTNAWLSNGGTAWQGKQGRFWYSDAFDSYMWVGQRNSSLEADFYMTTAPAPEGPWIKPYLIFSGENGDGALPSYSLQAHPALLTDNKEKGIWLTWTTSWQPQTYAGYITPLAYVKFKE